MSIDFNEALEMLVENISKYIKPDQQSYMQDAAEISQKLNDELININSIFKGSVYKWDQTSINLVLETCVDLRVVSNTGDVLLSAIASLIPLSESSGTLIYVFGKLLQFKQSDSVQMSELKDLFGVH
ncbi:uncharacterized protein LOC119554340 isoform X2 [Drosophila subpulchrella]|uniref:uncharacterized protein LOC119554340 isoform X2 n=1 Tax=Drosophila subpulchrella TaxID=1486046 RepID=UPI0018A18EBB|nr:uncharacterized protein LOC119554340 isoform X2 [Drosophila subpulchrella]